MVFQHLTQRAYLDQWKLGKHLYLIDCKTHEATPFQSARSILGMEDVQSQEMEDAFADVERSLHELKSDAEVTDPNTIYKMAKWTALHYVRSKRHVEILKTDYRLEVEGFTNSLVQLHAFFVSRRPNADGLVEPTFITCDNPCLYLKHGDLVFWLVPLSPFKYISFAPQRGWYESLPWDFNKNVLAAATEYCVSFDPLLHTEKPSFNLLLPPTE
jgi:hypothetical protein